MFGNRSNPPGPPADPALLTALKGVPTAALSDNLSRFAGVVGLKPMYRGARMAGAAFTARTRPGDNLAVHRALPLLRPGDVLVVDGGGDISRALVGEVMKTIAETKGCVGFVIDGVIRDAAAFAAGDFPCFARGAIHIGPTRHGPCELNVPVTIGGAVIEPGDIVVGDEDGVLAFPQTVAKQVMDAALAQEAKEVETLKAIREGRYDGGYSKEK